MTQRKPAIATRVSPAVNTCVRRLTKALGITISEYLRRLIFQDLDSRKMFEDELKKAVEQSDEEKRASRKPHSPKNTILKHLVEAARREDDEEFL